MPSLGELIAGDQDVAIPPGSRMEINFRENLKAEVILASPAENGVPNVTRCIVTDVTLLALLFEKARPVKADSKP